MCPFVTWVFVICTLCSGAFLSGVASAGDAVASAQERSLLALINAERTKAKLSPLRAAPILSRAARAHAVNMARQQKLDHTLDGKTFAERMADTGYRTSAIGENIAQTGNDPGEAMTIWMKSPAHKDNLLNPGFQEIGVGIAVDAKGLVYYTLIFAAPAMR
jgi:uncharacterized protein YkwD